MKRKLVVLLSAAMLASTVATTLPVWGESTAVTT